MPVRFLLLLMFFAAPAAHAQTLADFLDSSFGTDGLVASAYPGTPLDAVSDGTGRLVVVGIGTGTEAGFYVARYLADGTPDPDFGSGGLVALPSDDAVLGPADLNPITVGVQFDGRIVVATRRATGTGVAGLVFCLEEDGGLDTDFADEGWLFTEQTLSDLEIMPDGRLLLALQSDDPTAPDLLRLLDDGAPDPTFGTDGAVDLSQAMPGFRAFVFAPTGGLDTYIRVAGTKAVSAPRPALLQLTADGTVDTDFGRFGIAVDSVRTAAQVADVVQDLYRRNALFFPDEGIGVSRLYGTLDQDFGSGGFVRIGPAGSVPRGALVLRDGRLLAAGSTSLVLLQPDGTPDPLFGPEGWLPSGWNALAAQPDARTVLAGGMSGAWTLARIDLTPLPGRAALETSFGSGGIVTADVGRQDWSGITLERPDGRLLTVGRSFAEAADGTLTGLMTGVQRWPDGRPDRSFGDAGRVQVESEPGASVSAGSAVLQPDGRVVVAGGDGVDILLMRFEEDGSLDPAFGKAGVVHLDFPGSYNWAADLLLLPDGRLLVLARLSGGEEGFNTALLRLASDGTLDPTFGSDGVGPLIPLESPTELVVLDDGRLLIAGSQASDPALARLTPDGALDPSFGNDGLAVVDDEGAWFSDLAVRTDGRIVASAWRNAIGSSGFIAQFDPAGALDPTFGEGGIAAVSLSDPEAYPFGLAGLALLPDDHFLITGQGFRPDPFPAAPAFFAFVGRFSPDGYPDTTFGDGGFLTLDLTHGQDAGLAIRLLADGHALVTGGSGLGDTDFLLVKLDPGSDLVSNAPSASDPSDALALYPNPAADRVTFSFDLGVPGEITLDVFDLLGRRVARLAEGPRTAGAHTVSWSPALPSGVYLARLQTPDRSQTRRVTITR